MFDNAGLLFIEDGRIRSSQFGRFVKGSFVRLEEAAENIKREIALSAIGVLGRYQLLNPTTANRKYPIGCDVFPFRAIWQAMLTLGDLHWEELHRVILRVMSTADLASAIERITAARAEAEYNPNDNASAEHFLGSKIYADSSQARRRMTPWFSLAGFGWLLITRDAKDGRRFLVPEYRAYIEDELRKPRSWIDFGTDVEAYFRHLDQGVIEHRITPGEIKIKSDDAILQRVEELLFEDNWGGVLLTGVPGTGKSWYARQIALYLTGGDQSLVREIQFHQSYQYEDFVEGYVPNGDLGFKLKKKHLLEMCEIAHRTRRNVVMVIDEFSRSDPARVFGEILTYMEATLRGTPFYLPSGTRVSVPANLRFIATMNPEDRSVDEVDAAMDRRWAKINLRPDPKRVAGFLSANGAPSYIIGPTMEFFNRLQPLLPVGHAFFVNVKSEASLRRLWEAQICPMAEKRFRFDPEARRSVEGLWEACSAAMLAAAPALRPTASSGEAGNNAVPQTGDSPANQSSVGGATSETAPESAAPASSTETTTQ